MKITIRAAVFAGILAFSSLVACSKNTSPPAVLAEARDLIGKGKAGEARIALKNLIDAHPEATAAFGMLAQLELDSGSPQNAELELAKIPEGSFNDLDSQTARIRTMVALGKFNDALTALDSNTVRLIAVSQRAVLRAQALRGLGRPGEALQVLRAASQADANNPTLVVETATTLAALGNLAPAEQELDRLIAAAKAPEPEALRARGDLRLRGGYADKAIEDYRAALKAAPLSWPLITRFNTELALGDAQLAAGHTDEAKAQIAKLKTLAPKAFPLGWLVGRVAMAESRFGDAVDSLQRVSEELPGNAPVQYLLIEALLRTGNVVRATAELEKRIQIEPSDLRARQMLAQLSLQQNRPGRVVELLGEAGQDAAKSDPSVSMLLASAREAQDRAAAAISTLGAQLAKTPSNGAVRTDLAGAYLLSGDANRAIKVLQDAVPPLTTSQAVGVEVSARLALGNERELNTLVKSLLDSDSVPIEALLGAAEAAQRGGRSDLARNFVERALQRDPASEQALLGRANLDFAERKFEPAKAALEALLKKHPKDQATGMALARVLESQGDLAGARNQLQALAKDSSNPSQPLLMLAAMELRADKVDAANAAFDKVLAANPKDGRAANSIGLLLLGSKKFDQASARFREAIAQNGDNAEIWFNLGRAQVGAQDMEGARQSFNTTVAKKPDWIEANAIAVRLNAGQGHVDEARRLVDALVVRTPSNASAWALAGDVARMEKRFDDARKAYAQSYGLKANGVVAVAEFESRVAGGLPGADVPLTNWLARQPDDMPVRRRLAEYYMQSGNSKAAMAQMDAVLKKFPNDLGMLNNMAWLLASSDIKRAESYARTAAAIDPQNPAIADTLGVVLLEQKRYAEARKVLERAAKGMPKDGGVQYRYALALARNDERAAAKSVLDALLAANLAFPDLERAKQLAQELTP